jgi:hypothetical protein
MHDDLKLRVPVQSSLTVGTSPGTYNLAVENAGIAGRGRTAENITVTLILKPGTTVTNASGAGYRGVRNDAEAKADVAVWQVPRLGPKEQQTYNITLNNAGGVASGHVRWTSPGPATGKPDENPVTMPQAAQR